LTCAPTLKKQEWPARTTIDADERVAVALGAFAGIAYEHSRSRGR